MIVTKSVEAALKEYEQRRATLVRVAAVAQSQTTGFDGHRIAMLNAAVELAEAVSEMRRRGDVRILLEEPEKT